MQTGSPTDSGISCFQRYLYEQTGCGRTAKLHLMVGHHLEDLYGECRREISLSLAWHFELGGDLERAVTYLLEAGKRAAQMTAAEDALRLLNHGLGRCSNDWRIHPNVSSWKWSCN